MAIPLFSCREHCHSHMWPKDIGSMFQLYVVVISASGFRILSVPSTDNIFTHIGDLGTTAGLTFNDIGFVWSTEVISVIDRNYVCSLKQRSLTWYLPRMRQPPHMVWCPPTAGSSRSSHQIRRWSAEWSMNRELHSHLACYHSYLVKQCKLTFNICATTTQISMLTLHALLVPQVLTVSYTKRPIIPIMYTESPIKGLCMKQFTSTNKINLELGSSCN